jgi:hypothetical protein
LGGAIGLPIRALAGLDQLEMPAAPASVIEGSMGNMSRFHIREVDVNLCEKVSRLEDADYGDRADRRGLIQTLQGRR